MVFDKMPRRSEQERRELVGASGARGLDGESHSIQRYLGAASESSKGVSLLRNEKRLLAAVEEGSSDRKEKDKS